MKVLELRPPDVKGPLSSKGHSELTVNTSARTCVRIVNSDIRESPKGPRGLEVADLAMSTYVDTTSKVFGHSAADFVRLFLLAHGKYPVVTARLTKVKYACCRVPDSLTRVEIVATVGGYYTRS